jgi:hypothetical protein
MVPNKAVRVDEAFQQRFCLAFLMRRLQESSEADEKNGLRTIPAKFCTHSAAKKIL